MPARSSGISLLMPRIRLQCGGISLESPCSTKTSPLLSNDTGDPAVTPTDSPLLLANSACQCCRAEAKRRNGQLLQTLSETIRPLYHLLTFPGAQVLTQQATARDLGQEVLRTLQDFGMEHCDTRLSWPARPLFGKTLHRR